MNTNFYVQQMRKRDNSVAASEQIFTQSLSALMKVKSAAPAFPTPSAPNRESRQPSFHEAA